MKKTIAFLSALALCFGLTACAKKTTPITNNMTPNEKALAEAEIRQALSLLIERNYLVEQIAQGGQVPASSFVAMGFTDADGSEFYENAGNSDDYTGYYNTAVTAYEENCRQAMEILKKYYPVDSNGKLVGFPTLTYLYNTADSHKAIGEYLQSTLGGIGINIKLENQEWNTFLDTRKSGNYSFARNGWVADYNDPICFLDMWTTTSGNNDVQFGKDGHGDISIYDLDLTPYGYDVKVEQGTWAQTYDVLIATIKGCDDVDTRYALMHLAEDLLMSTGTIMPIYFNTDLYMVDDALEGFYANPLGYKFFHNATVNGSNEQVSACIGSEPDTIDPALNSTLDGATLVSHLFAGLAKWDQDGEGKVIISPDCATALPEGVTNEDGTVTYTYTLKDNLKWSDGKALTAEDFAFAWKRAASTKLGADYGYMFEVIQGYPDNLAVSAVDNKTLTVTLTNDVPYWNELLAFPTYFPVRKDVVSNENWATEPSTYVSNGAYTITNWDHNSVIRMEKNPYYQDGETVTMKKINFYLSDDTNNMLVNFKNGSWQLIESVPTNEITVLKKEYPKELVIAGQIGTYYACWNINQNLLP